MNITVDDAEQLTILTALDTYIAECEKLVALTAGGDYSQTLDWSRYRAVAVRKKIARAKWIGGQDGSDQQ